MIEKVNEIWCRPCRWGNIIIKKNIWCHYSNQEMLYTTQNTDIGIISFKTREGIKGFDLTNTCNVYVTLLTLHSKEKLFLSYKNIFKRISSTKMNFILFFVGLWVWWLLQRKRMEKMNNNKNRYYAIYASLFSFKT